MKRKPSISHDEAMAKELRENPEFAVEYLRAALEEGDDPQILLIALRRIAESRGGVAKIAKEAGVERESLYRYRHPGARCFCGRVRSGGRRNPGAGRIASRLPRKVDRCESVADEMQPVLRYGASLFK